MGLRDAFQTPVVHNQSPKLNLKTSLSWVLSACGAPVWLLQWSGDDVSQPARVIVHWYVKVWEPGAAGIFSW